MFEKERGTLERVSNQLDKRIEKMFPLVLENSNEHDKQRQIHKQTDPAPYDDYAKMTKFVSFMSK